VEPAGAASVGPVSAGGRPGAMSAGAMAAGHHPFCRRSLYLHRAHT